MPIKNAAKKAFRQMVKRRAKNTLIKEKLHSLTKKFSKTVIAKKLDEAKTLLPKISQAVDKAAKNNIIKKNKASRIKSRLAISLNKIAESAKTK